MPTGYTADVQSGKVTDFKTFALRCARAMGALILMRDDAMDAPIPDEFKPDTEMYDRMEADARDTLGMLDALTPEDAQKKADAEFESLSQEHNKAMAKRREEKKRYEAMYAKVLEWQPPTSDHKGFKDFMAEQLLSSIDSDCEGYERYAPRRKTAKQWMADARAAAIRNLESAASERMAEIKRTADRNRWVKQLRESLEAAR